MKRILLYWMLPLSWAAVIFYTSSMPSSEQDIKPALSFLTIAESLEPVLRLIEFQYYGEIRSVEANGLLPFTEFLIRKLTHFGVYFVLAILMFFALQKTTSMKLSISLAFAWMLTVHFAIVDELNQSFTPERTPYYFDVAIDSVGALVGLLFCGLFVWWKKRRKG
ncbi:VanZ family protein [Allobacillus sp. GCM10007491]|uniref:VanZ family protein n=2 Tax=Allobacillus TaxID=1400133 RepID=A0A941CRP3_9BACI|nr:MULTISPECIES: VanZ family protein [Allobacillus]MBR7552662.1 VanZ family protein [Allobacillus saliphilus]TSJ66822.1 VanZ family protein [Allobacillus salarius]